MPSTILSQLANRFRAFRADEDGAVTVDFVVLTASVMLMGLAHAKDVADGTVNIADAIDECLENDIAAVMEGDPETYIQRLQTASVACSNR